MIATVQNPTPTSSRTSSLPLAMLHVVAVVVVSGLLGAATSFGQTFLPDALRPFANSASGWTLLTAVAVGAVRASTGRSAVLGAASFVALVLGYQLTSTLRGFPTSEVLFLVVGVVVGPFVGVAASWLRRDGLQAVVGCGVLAGIAVGEGAWGLLQVAATTGWFFWTLLLVAGLALLAAVLVRRARTARLRLLATGLTLLVAVSFAAAYTAVGSLAL